MCARAAGAIEGVGESARARAEEERGAREGAADSREFVVNESQKNAERCARKGVVPEELGHQCVRAHHCSWSRCIGCRISEIVVKAKLTSDCNQLSAPTKQR